MYKNIYWWKWRKKILRTKETLIFINKNSDSIEELIIPDFQCREETQFWSINKRKDSFVFAILSQEIELKCQWLTKLSRINCDLSKKIILHFMIIKIECSISVANVNKNKIKSIVYMSKKKLNNIIQKSWYYRIKLKFLKIKSTN